jgi:hypothetical protein
MYARPVRSVSQTARLPLVMWQQSFLEYRGGAIE